MSYAGKMRAVSSLCRDVGVTQGPTTFDQVASLRAARSSSQDVLSHVHTLLFAAQMYMMF